MCSKSGRPQQKAAMKDAHYTVLGFNCANGESLMCAIIFAAKEMNPERASGFNPFAAWIGDEDNVEENIGEGKQYPYWPTCIFKGKEIPCF